MIYAIFMGKEALRSIGEDEHYQVQKLIRDKEYYELTN